VQYKEKEHTDTYST